MNWTKWCALVKQFKKKKERKKFVSTSVTKSGLSLDFEIVNYQRN